MTDGWNPESQGTLVLPSGRILRGRALRKPVPDGPSPEFGLYLLGHDPGPTPWPIGGCAGLTSAFLRTVLPHATL